MVVMDDYLVVTLLRHGITDDNERHAYIGWTDSPLNQSGRQSLDMLRKSLTEKDLVFTSDLQRCVKTANYLFQTFTKKLMEFREINFGDWEGSTFADLQDDPHYQQWLQEPYEVKPPNGEHIYEFIDRVSKGWTKIQRAIIQVNARNVAVVTHGGVIRYLLATYGVPVRGFWEWRVPHGSGYELVWKVAGFKEGKRCISLREVPLTGNEHG